MSEVNESTSILQLMKLTEKKAADERERLLKEAERLEAEKEQLHIMERMEKKMDVLISTSQNLAQILPLIAGGDSGKVTEVLRKQQQDLMGVLRDIGRSDVNVNSVGGVTGDLVGNNKNLS